MKKMQFSCIELNDVLQNYVINILSHGSEWNFCLCSWVLVMLLIFNIAKSFLEKMSTSSWSEDFNNLFFICKAPIFFERFDNIMTMKPSKFSNLQRELDKALTSMCLMEYRITMSLCWILSQVIQIFHSSTIKSIKSSILFFLINLSTLHHDVQVVFYRYQLSCLWKLEKRKHLKSTKMVDPFVCSLHDVHIKVTLNETYIFAIGTKFKFY